MKGFIKIIAIGICILFSMGCASTGRRDSKQLPRLAVLPFTGATVTEGETIATLLTNRSEIQKNFTPILRTSILSAIKKQEQDFQRSFITDYTTTIAIGQDLKADFVVAGYIQSFKEYNFVFINIMDINTRQLVAGDYKQYKKLEDIPGLLSDMAKKIVRVPGNKNKNMLELAVLPFSIPANEATAREAEVLAQIAAIEIVNSGKYVVLPRTQEINKAFGEKLFEPSVLGDRVVLQNLQKALNAKNILAGQTGSIGTKRYFSMQIVNLEDGRQLKGSDAEYQKITDGIRRIPLLAQVISEQKTEIQKEQELDREKKRVAAAAAKQERKYAWGKRKSLAFRNHWDAASGYFQWGDEMSGGGGSLLIAGVHWSPIPFTVLGLETRFGALDIGGAKGAALGGAFTLGLVYPFNEHIKLFGDGIFEFGNFARMNGFINKNATPGFDAGLQFWFDYESIGFDIKYRGNWYENNYLHAIGIDFILLGGSSWKLW
jgi:hypothetical protein